MANRRPSTHILDTGACKSQRNTAMQDTETTLLKQVKQNQKTHVSQLHSSAAKEEANARNALQKGMALVTLFITKLKT